MANFKRDFLKLISKYNVTTVYKNPIIIKEIMNNLEKYSDYKVFVKCKKCHTVHEINQICKVCS